MPRKEISGGLQLLGTQAYNHPTLAPVLARGAALMSSEGSVTTWIGQLRAGDPAAAQLLWERYFLRLVGLARKRLQNARRRAADEEDVALSAFASFCRKAIAGQFPQLADRDDLWRLLVTITARKAAHLRRDEGRQKRGGGDVRSLAQLSNSASGAEAVLEQLVDREPTPAFAALVAEESRRLLECLGDDQLRTIALCKLEGDTNDAIARKLGCVRATVQRKLTLIREIWAQETGP
jgi:DNA-directed RNA polymerase specialized sigma24 family protein